MSSMAVRLLTWWALVVMGIVALGWPALTHSCARSYGERVLDEFLADGLTDKGDYLRRRRLLRVG